MEVAVYVLGVLSGLALIVASVTNAQHRDFSLWAYCAAAVFAVVASFCWYQDRLWAKESRPATTLFAAKLPGFSLHCRIRLHHLPADRRKYLFDIGSTSKERLSVYVTRDNIFTMSFTDAKNEPHPIQIPVGGAGIPIHEFFYLGCEVGLTDRETLLRIIVDGRELRTLTLPFRADIGSLDVPNGVFGADLNGGNCAQVDLAEIVVYSGTLDPTGVKAFSDHFQKENYLRLERGNAYAEFNGTQWSRIKDAPPGQRDGIQPDPEKRPTYRLLKE